MLAPEQKLKAICMVRHEGATLKQAASAVGAASHAAVIRWLSKHDDSFRGTCDLLSHRPEGEEPCLIDVDSLPDDPEELKRIIFDLQFEKDLAEAVVDVLKKDPGVDPTTLPNREKAMVVDALAKRGGRYSTSFPVSSLRLAQATSCYHRKRLGRDPDADVRDEVVAACKVHRMWGHGRIGHLAGKGARKGAGVSEKRVRRVMGQEGLQPPRRRKASRHGPCDARKDSGEALPNAPLREDGTHDLAAPRPNRLWVSDVTEFRLPSGERAFLSPVTGCSGSSLVGWRASVSERAEDLTSPSLVEAASSLSEGDECWAHTDRGGQCLSAGWIGACERFGISRSMSRKGHSPDNARMEGFFGRLKMEFFDVREWEGASAQDFIRELDSWLSYCNEERPKMSLGRLSPMQYRRRYLEAA